MTHDLQRVVIAHVPDDASAVQRLIRLAAALEDVLFLAVGDTPAAALAVSSASAGKPNVKYLHLDVPLGKGAALRAGFNATQAELVAFLDLGGDADAAEIAGFFDELEQNRDLDGIIGNRRPVGVRRPFFQDAASRAYNAFARVLFGLTAPDPQAPVKVFARCAIGRIFEDLRLYNYGFDVELLFQAKRHKLRVKSEAMRWNPAPRMWPLWSTSLQALTALAAIRLLYSPLERLPFVDLLGRKFYLPVKRSYSIMLFCWRDPRSPLAGGGEAYLYEQAKCWVQAGHRVTWFAQSFAGCPAEEDLEGVRIVRRGRFPAVFLWGAVWYLFKSGHRFDFIVDCMNGIPFFTPLFSTKPKVCLVYHIHSHHFKDELPPGIAHLAMAVETKLVPLVYRNTPFLTISDSTKREMLDLRITQHQIDLVHSGVSSALRPGVKASAPTIVHLGRLKRYKRVRDLIDAFVAVKKQVPDARLVIAGSGDDEVPLREYVVQHGVEDVEFLGRVDEATKARVLQEAWLFGMPSAIEGWGIVVIEANACGTPAVAYNVSGLRDCIVDGKTGLLADTPEEFAEHMIRLLQDAGLRERMSRDALDWSQNFSWAASASRTLDLIRRRQRWRAIFEPDSQDRDELKLRIPVRQR